MNLPQLALLQWPNNNTTAEQWSQLSQLLNQLNEAEKIWLSGYLAASGQLTNNPAQIKPEHHPSTAEQLTVLYGSQTGNGATVAKHLQAAAKAAGLQVVMHSLADFPVKKLVKQNLVSLVISTHGEGEAPDDAEQFYSYLFGPKAPDLGLLKFNVLALGDSSYEHYCQTGKELDERLEELGAKRLTERVDCDVDYHDDAESWIEVVVETAKINLSSASPNNITALPLPTQAEYKLDTLANRQNPYLAEILTLQKITGEGSSKDTYHIELAIDPAKIQYQPGDSLAIWATNDTELVTQLLSHWDHDRDTKLNFKKHHASLQTLLTAHVEITQISKPFIQFLSQQIPNEKLQALAASHAAFSDYCDDHQLLDLLLEFDPSATISAQQALNQLKSITPRLYSIASAQAVEEDEVHLTINLTKASQSGHHGLASGWFCKQATMGDEVLIYVEPNDNFRLPVNPETPIVMIGPGTGVAPFRAFVQYRQELSANGENWLIFGNPNFSTDFLYQAEWLKALKIGSLTQLDVAFSRDQEQKIYVQDKLKSQAQKLWSWIQRGACIYVCGDATYMAKDVETALLEVIGQQGQLGAVESVAYLKELKRSNRYQKDVY